MSTMTDTTTDREKMQASLTSLLERAESIDPDWALTNESPLSLEVSGKYVNVLFSTGGPHTEITVEYDDAEAAEYWFENDPQGAWFTRMDWGTREDQYIGRYEAAGIMQAITRDPDELTTTCRHCDEPITHDDNGAGGKVWVHDFGSTVCYDDPPGSHEDGDTTTVAEPATD